MDGTRFCQFLATRTTYDKEILRDIRPFDNYWLSRMSRGSWDAYSNSVLIQNRFRHVDAPQDRLWRDYANANCTTTPCDPEENEIGYGQTQLQYGLKRQSWRSPVFCFDQVMTQVLAREQMDQIVADILRPATSRITSNLYRISILDAANAAGNCFMATGGMEPFTFTWDTTNDRLQGFTVATGTQEPTSLLTVEHMKSRYLPLVMKGAMGKNPTDMGHYLEAVTDLESIYRLERTANVVQAGTTPLSSASQWRWTSFADNAKFHKYGWSGALGNFGMGTDLYVFRFNKVGTGQYQLVPPYNNVEITSNGGGMRSVPNDNWRSANFQFTIMWHQEAVRALWFRAAPLHGQMPLLVRDFTGNWRFAIDNIGVPNPRRNKGYFYADFMCGIKPRYTEFIEAVFHAIQPETIVAQARTSADITGAKTQPYEPSTLPCCQEATYTHTFTVFRKKDFSIVIPASGLTCNGNIVANAQITVAAPGTNDAAGFTTQLTSLATALNGSSTPSAAMGTWSKSSDNKLTLTGTRCSSVSIAFATS
jgi:hypothetical protein